MSYLPFGCKYDCAYNYKSMGWSSCEVNIIIYMYYLHIKPSVFWTDQLNIASYSPY